MTGTRASVLVGLLWCLALLSLLVIGVLHTASLDLRVVKNYGDQIQAHYLALAGIEKAKALLYHDAIERKSSAQNHNGALYDAPQDFQDVPLGRGQFRVFRQDDRGKILFGVSDEESRLNVNRVSAEELASLARLLHLESDLAAAILDWRDEDNLAAPNGAEADYYASLQPPYQPRNGPFQTVRELLLVRGVTPESFLGEDSNQNGLLDPEEDDGDATHPPDNQNGVLEAGWSALVTTESAVQNLNAAGQERINIKSADENALTSVRGISSALAKAIIAYRGQNKFENIADLLEVTAVAPQNQAAPGPNQPGSPRPGPQPPNVRAPQPAQPAGPKLVSEDLFLEIADDLTAADEPEQPGAINVNTARAEVLACLPGVNLELAQAIVSYRKSAGFLPNIAWLLRVPGMTREIFKQVAPKVTARSETFRILSEGRIASTGARKRLEAVVRIGSSRVDTLLYREDL